MCNDDIQTRLLVLVYILRLCGPASNLASILHPIVQCSQCPRPL